MNELESICLELERKYPQKWGQSKIEGNVKRRIELTRNDNVLVICPNYTALENLNSKVLDLVFNSEELSKL